MSKKCLTCGAAVAARSTGRPLTYCSKGCRRVAEYEIRRVNETISKLEFDARWLRNPARLPLQSDAEHLAFLLDEIEAARERLRKLLSG